MTFNPQPAKNLVATAYCKLSIAVHPTLAIYRFRLAGSTANHVI